MPKPCRNDHLRPPPGTRARSRRADGGARVAARRGPAGDRRRLDRRHRRAAREGGAKVVSFGETAGCARGSPRATARRWCAATTTAGGSTPTASIPADELARMLELVQGGRVRRRDRLALLPVGPGRGALQARAGARLRHVAAAAAHAPAARAGDLGRHERAVRGQPRARSHCWSTPTCARRQRSRRWCASPTPSCACSRCPCTCASASTASHRSAASGGRAGA